MARIRTIKPEFFRAHELYQREAEANRKRAARPYLNIRLAFAGLLTAADREGRFKWRPEELKLDCLPYDLVDFSEVMAVLAAAPQPFIVKYLIDGVEYGVIPTFLKHQRPHHAEAQSSIPKPPDILPIPDEKPKEDGQPKVNRRSIVARKGIEGKGIEGKEYAPSALEAGSEPEAEKPLTPLQRVVGAYKIAKGNDRDDKAWDAANFGRYSKAAKSLLGCFAGDEKAAIVYLLGQGQEFDEKSLSWTLETIARHAWDNKNKLTEGTDGSEHGKVGPDNLLGSRRSSRATPAGELAGEVLRGLTAQGQAPAELE